MGSFVEAGHNKKGTKNLFMWFIYSRFDKICQNNCIKQKYQGVSF